jgi:hypothetical protein
MPDERERHPLMQAPPPILYSELRCPQCGRVSLEQMPQDACVFFHSCPGCGVILRPRPGDCCVFCSYGSVPCPPVQQQRSCCGAGP